MTTYGKRDVDGSRGSMVCRIKRSTLRNLGLGRRNKPFRGQHVSNRLGIGYESLKRSTTYGLRVAKFQPGEPSASRASNSASMLFVSDSTSTKNLSRMTDSPDGTILFR